MILIFDTETTGLPQNYNAPLTDFNNWPRVVQIAWQLHEPSGKLVSQGNRIVRPDGFSIPYNAEKVHGISTDRALREGLPLSDVMAEFLADVAKATIISGHNIEFDLNITGCELLRLGQDNVLPAKKIIDTKEVSTDFCALPGGKGGRFNPAARAAPTGKNADVVAVLLVSSARQMMMNKIEQTTAGAGSEAA